MTPNGGGGGGGGPPGEGAVNGDEGDGDAALEIPGGCGVKAAGGGPSMEKTLISSWEGTG